MGPTQPFVHWVPVALSSGVKLNLIPASTKVKNDWSHTSTPTCAFIACTETTLPLPDSVYSYFMIDCLVLFLAWGNFL